MGLTRSKHYDRREAETKCLRLLSPYLRFSRDENKVLVTSVNMNITNEIK